MIWSNMGPDGTLGSGSDIAMCNHFADVEVQAWWRAEGEKFLKGERGLHQQRAKLRKGYQNLCSNLLFSLITHTPSSGGTYT